LVIIEKLQSKLPESEIKRNLYGNNRKEISIEDLDVRPTQIPQVNRANSLKPGDSVINLRPSTRRPNSGPNNTQKPITRPGGSGSISNNAKLATVTRKPLNNKHKNE